MLTCDYVNKTMKRLRCYLFCVLRHVTTRCRDCDMSMHHDIVCALYGVARVRIDAIDEINTTSIVVLVDATTHNHASMHAITFFRDLSFIDIDDVIAICDMIDTTNANAFVSLTSWIFNRSRVYA